MLKHKFLIQDYRCLRGSTSDLYNTIVCIYHIYRGLLSACLYSICINKTQDTIFSVLPGAQAVQNLACKDIVIYDKIKDTVQQKFYNTLFSSS